MITRRGGHATCYWCDLVTPRPAWLFVNGHGWQQVCPTCDEIAGECAA